MGLVETRAIQVPGRRVKYRGARAAAMSAKAFRGNFCREWDRCGVRVCRVSCARFARVRGNGPQGRDVVVEKREVSKVTQTQESNTAAPSSAEGAGAAGAAAAAVAASGSWLSSPPRPETRRVRQRAWGDIHVRFWWLSALAVIGVMTYFTAWRISDALRDRAIIRHGQVVQTTITSVDGGTTPGYAVLRHERVPVTLSGKLADGREITFAGPLSVAAGYAKVGQPMTIRVDPSDPAERWTDRTEVVPWVQELALTLMFLPVIAALLVTAFVMRGKILRVWREGTEADGEILELHTSAIAPLSRRVKYKLTGGSSERRLFSALWPNRAGPLAVGQHVKLLVGRDGRSILAHLYGGEDRGVAPASASASPAAGATSTHS